MRNTNVDNINIDVFFRKILRCKCDLHRINQCVVIVRNKFMQAWRIFFLGKIIAFAVKNTKRTRFCGKMESYGKASKMIEIAAYTALYYSVCKAKEIDFFDEFKSASISSLRISYIFSRLISNWLHMYCFCYVHLLILQKQKFVVLI